MRGRRGAVCAVIFLFMEAAAQGAAGLTLSRCIAEALNSHPDLAAAEGTVQSRRAAVSLAAVDSRLTAWAYTGYSRSREVRGGGGVQGNWSSGVSLSQKIYDWGKIGTAVKGAELSAQFAEKAALNARETVVADVRSAYYALNKALRDAEVQRQRLSNYRRRLEWAKSYYAAGTKAKIEVTKAETDLANARLALIGAQSQAEQCKARLAAAMGDPAREIDGVKDELAFVPWEISLAEALKRAQRQRSDLAEEALRVKKAENDVKAAKLTGAPALDASVGYHFGGSGYDDRAQWTAGLNLSLPVSDGGETGARVAQARADLKVAAARRDKLAQAVALDVRTAWQNLRESAASVAAARAVEKGARENLNLALGRYRAGAGTALEVSDAVDSCASAQSAVITSLYNHKEARLSLEKAMGEVPEG